MPRHAIHGAIWRMGHWIGKHVPSSNGGRAAKQSWLFAAEARQRQFGEDNQDCLGWGRSQSPSNCLRRRRRGMFDCMSCHVELKMKTGVIYYFTSLCFTFRDAFYFDSMTVSCSTNLPYELTTREKPLAHARPGDQRIVVILHSLRIAI
jgi:hypothetical protein